MAIPKFNLNWHEWKKKMQPRWQPKKKTEAAAKIQGLAKRKHRQTDAPRTAKENADKLALLLTASKKELLDLKVLFNAALKTGIVENKVLWLTCHEGHWHESILGHDDFRAWIAEEAAKSFLGNEPSAKAYDELLEKISRDVCREKFKDLRENAVLKKRAIRFKGGKNMFPLRQEVILVEGGKIKHLSYSDVGAAFKYQIDAQFELNADGHYTRRFLTDFLGTSEDDDPAAWKRFWEQFSYLIIPNQAAKAVIIWYGLGDDGKSTLVWVLKLIVLPQGAVNDNDVQNTSDAFGMSSCHDKLIIVLHETNHPISAGTAELWKKLSGDDGLTVNRKHKDKIQSEGCPKLLVTTNHFPTFKPGVLDRALESRLEMLQVYRPEHEKDPELKNKLYAERDYIVTQAILGYARLQANNYKFTECKKDSDLKELVVNGEAACAFLQDCADPTCLERPQPGVFTHASVLRERFKRWKEATGEKLTYKDLCATLRIRGFQYGRIRASSDDEFDGFGVQPRVWRGLKLKE